MQPLFKKARYGFTALSPSLRMRRAIAMVSSGNGTAIVWNPGPEGKLADFADDDWNKFVCVEPVTAWPKATHSLAPGENHQLLVAIQSVLDDAEEAAQA